MSHIKELSFYLFFIIFTTVIICQTTIPVEKIQLPLGFKVSVFARVQNARQMSISPRTGIIYVGTREAGIVHALVPQGNGTFQAIVIARNLTMPVGVAWHDGSLYTTSIDRILRYDNIDDRIRNPPTPIQIGKFPADVHHGWKYIKIYQNKIYIAVGAPCNVCLRELPYASIIRLDLDGSNQEVIATGVRNTVGFDFNPLKPEELWFTDNGRDNWGDDRPPDELNYLQLGAKVGHYGFPFCHGKGLLDPEFGNGKNCKDYIDANVELGPHVAALGLTFYKGTSFPERYRNGIFICEHGSWNRVVPLGYRVSFIDRHSLPVYKVFADGWLQLPPNGTVDVGKFERIKGSQMEKEIDDKDSRFAFGRPVDIINYENGLLVSDDKAGAIYRIEYIGNYKN